MLGKFIAEVKPDFQFGKLFKGHPGTVEIFILVYDNTCDKVHKWISTRVSSFSIMYVREFDNAW